MCRYFHSYPVWDCESSVIDDQIIPIHFSFWRLVSSVPIVPETSQKSLLQSWSWILGLILELCDPWWWLVWNLQQWLGSCAFIRSTLTSLTSVHTHDETLLRLCIPFPPLWSKEPELLTCPLINRRSAESSSVGWNRTFTWGQYAGARVPSQRSMLFYCSLIFCMPAS